MTEQEQHDNLYRALQGYADNILKLKITEQEERDYRKRGFNKRVFDIENYYE